MEFILAAVLAGLAAFVCLLSYFDLSPKTGLLKIMGRLFTLSKFPGSIKTDAPYRRVRRTANWAHKPVLLNLQTSDGSGQACHPDVVYVPEGFGVEKWPYWMVCTPYPYGDDSFENPEIFVSCDGLTWSIPKGLSNPIIPPLEVAGDHNSDPDILHYENKLWLFYRETLRSKTPRQNAIYLTRSLDGVEWSRPIEILRDTDGRELLSPAVIHDGNRFVMWTIEIHEDEFKVMRRFSVDGLRWSAGEVGAISGIEAPRHPWHIDVLKEDDRLSAALVSCTARNGGGSRIHYAYSLDEGLNWQISEFLFEQIYEFESQLQYRGTLRKIADPARGYEFWYSAASSTNMFSIAYLQLFRKEDTLMHLEPTLRSDQTVRRAGT
jgi:hypothetical protein